MPINGTITVDVEVDQTNNNLIAHVNLRSRSEVGTRFVSTEEVRGELARQGWTVSECLARASVNNVAEQNKNGSWIFSLGTPHAPETAPVTNVEQTKTPIKKTSNRRRKPTTKK